MDFCPCGFESPYSDYLSGKGYEAVLILRESDHYIIRKGEVFMATIDITATGAKIHDMAKAAGFTAKDFADACCLTNRTER